MCSAKTLRCTLIPHAENDGELLQHVIAGTPCTCSDTHAADVYQRTGEDGVKFLTGGPWNTFKKPKIAFVSGWGAPGQSLVRGL